MTTDITSPDDIAYLVLATIDSLGEATAFSIYQTHTEQDTFLAIALSLDLPTVNHALWRLRDTGMIDVGGITA